MLDYEKNNVTFTFNTHDRTPRTPMRRHVKILWIVIAALFYGMFTLIAVVASMEAHSPLPALLILLLALGMTALVAFIYSDVNKAYVEIDGGQIHVVDYYFGIKREKILSSSKIKSVKKTLSSSILIPGYRVRFGCYLLFRGENRKYLFKVLACPETETFFREYTWSSFE